MNKRYISILSVFLMLLVGSFSVSAADSHTARGDGDADSSCGLSDSLSSHPYRMARTHHPPKRHARLSGFGSGGTTRQS